MGHTQYLACSIRRKHENYISHFSNLITEQPFPLTRFTLVSLVKSNCRIEKEIVAIAIKLPW